MRFFEDTNGTMRAISQIKTIYARSRSIERYGVTQKTYPVDLEGGENCEVLEHERDRIMKAPLFIVPAQPGTYLLGPVGELDDVDDDLGPWQTPVLAWGLSNEGFFEPYTADGHNDALANPGDILLPNGMVTSPAARSWRTLEDWVASQREQAEKASAKVPDESGQAR